jgi:predicted GIY-YIG superfamily endonuclease
MLRKRRKRRLRSAESTEKQFHHNVYVILLSDRALKELSILRLNPKRHPAKPCVYVGMTGLPVDHRFENHKTGYKAARIVRRYGVRLMPELYAHLNPMPFEAAAQMEKELAEDLRNEGYTVAGGT